MFWRGFAGACVAVGCRLCTKPPGAVTAVAGIAERALVRAEAVDGAATAAEVGLLLASSFGSTDVSIESSVAKASWSDAPSESGSVRPSSA